LDQATLDQATFWVALVAAVAAIATIVYGEIKPATTKKATRASREAARTCSSGSPQTSKAGAKKRLASRR
jgi:hypothetical protein